MAFLLQNLKDFADNRYALLGAGTALGASALIALGYCYRKHRRRKKRDMSSFPNLRNNRTIMGKHLTPDMFSKLKDRCTLNGYDFEKLIESGVRETTSYDKLSASFGLIENSAGLLAGDEECYDLFSELIDPVIGEIHQIDHMESLRSEVNLDWRHIKGGKLYGANVLSCRLSTRRNIQGYPMIPGCTEAALLRVGHVIGKTLECIEEAFGRCFFSLPWQYKKPVLEEYGLHPDSFPPQLSRDWPKGRLIWFTEDRECRVFINFLDHIQLVITQPGGDLQNAFRKYSELLSSIEGNLNRKGKKFMWSSKFGFLASSPHNVGTGLEVQVKVRLETLCKDSRFERIMDVLPVKLEHGDDPLNNVLSISNKHKLQLSEQKTHGVDQSLVDHGWNNCNFKDLVFGDLWRFLDVGLVLVLLITSGRATRYVADRQLMMAGPRRAYFCFLAFHVILVAAVGITFYKVPVVFFLYLAPNIYIGHLGFQHCAIYFDSSFRFILATFLFMLNRRGLIIGSHLALVMCYFDENYVEFASIPVLLLLSTVAGIASVALLFLIGPLQMPFGSSQLVKNVKCFINENLGSYRLLLSIFIGLILGFSVATWLVSMNEFETKTPTTWRSSCSIIVITAFLLSLHFELIETILYRSIFVTEDGDIPWGPYYILFIFVVFYHIKLTLTAPCFYFVIIFPLFICFTFYEEWCCFHDIRHVKKCLPYSSTTLALMASGEFNVKLLKSALDDKFSSFKLKILDFAGDKEYYAYHHMFLKSQAIYLIVFNIAKLLENNFRGIVRLQFWLESVCSHVPPKTPIFLVGTHRGDMDKTCMERLSGHLKTNLWDFYCDELVVNDVDDLIFFPVENSKGKDDLGVQSLQTKIMSVAEESEATENRNIPLSWIRIQDAVIQLREKKEANFCVTLEEFPRAFGNFICTNWSKETLKYFHEKGLVIYLDKDQELSEWVLLKPEILVDIIIQLVTPAPQMMQERGFRRDWRLLKDKGLLTKTLLESIISKVQEDEEAMTAFLEEYDLICPLSNKKVNMCSLSDDEEHQPTHFVPSMLPMSADGSIPVWHDSTTDKKFYVLFTWFLPEPLFHRLLSRAHKNSKVEFPNGPTVVFRDVGKFWMSPWQPYRLKLMKEEGVMEVTFSSSIKHGMKPADVLCQVFSMVDGICKRDFPFVKFHCGPACPADECPGYHDNYMHTPHQHTRRHVYNVMPGRQGDNIVSLYCVNNSFEEELEEWIP